MSCFPMKELSLVHSPLALGCLIGQDTDSTFSWMALPQTWIGPELLTQAQRCVEITLLSEDQGIRSDTVGMLETLMGLIPPGFFRGTSVIGSDLYAFLCHFLSLGLGTLTVSLPTPKFGLVHWADDSSHIS